MNLFGSTGFFRGTVGPGRICPEMSMVAELGDRGPSPARQEPDTDTYPMAQAPRHDRCAFRTDVLQRRDLAL
jgi:hypothetical protein